MTKDGGEKTLVFLLIRTQKDGDCKNVITVCQETLLEERQIYMRDVGVMIDKTVYLRR